METSFSNLLDRAVARAASDAQGVTDPNGIFVHVKFPDLDVAFRGWKLHVSATPFSAESVLNSCLDVLLMARVPFKFAASVDRLVELNEGVAGLSQVGKFITVYPPTPEVAVRVAQDLDRATAGERGPSILTDRPLSPTSLVHYRYADFAEGSPVESADAPPDPFVAAGLVDEGPRMVVGSRYLITATLHKAIRGAVQLAVDTQQKRSVILKRAWRDALITPDGRDARDRLRDEAELLRRLEGDGHFPQVWDVFEDFGDLFVAMELLDGTTVARAVSDGEMPFDVLTVARELAAALRSMHQKGFVHRDLNPVNVIVDGGVKLIDLELARPIGAPGAEYGAGTEGYLSENQQRGGAAVVLDDLYGLGCLLYFVATGADPSPRMTRADIGNAVRSQPEVVRVLIEGLLDEANPGWTTIDEVLGMLATATMGS